MTQEAGWPMFGHALSGVGASGYTVETGGLGTKRRHNNPSIGGCGNGYTE